MNIEIVVQDLYERLKILEDKVLQQELEIEMLKGIVDHYLQVEKESHELSTAELYEL